MSGASTPVAARGENHELLVYHVAWLAACTAVLALAMLLNVSHDGNVVLPLAQMSLPETCWFKRIVGIGCPGCGLTRCFICLAQGQFARAWDFNPTGYALFGLLLAQLPYRALQIRRLRRNLPPWRPHRLATWVVSLLAVLLLVQWVWRWLL